MMERPEAAATFGDFAAIARRRWRLIITIIPAAILIATWFAFAIQPIYRSTATVLLELSSVEDKLIQTTVTSYANQQIEIVQGRVMTAEALQKLVAKNDPYPDRTDLNAGGKARQIILDTEIERVDPVTFEPLDESNAFSLHYKNPDSERAATIAKQLSDLFLTYHQTSRTDSARQAERFLAEQTTVTETELKALDVQIAQLKITHGDALPDAENRNQAGLDRADRDLETIERSIRTSEEERSLLELQLAQISPYIATTEGDVTDLPTLRSQLAEAERRYTADHPDVKRLRRAVENAATQAATTGGLVRPADNPEYLRVRSQLDAMRKELSAQQATAAKIRGQIGQYESNLRSSPLIERQYADLQRKRDSLQNQYEDLSGRLKKAQLGYSFESGQAGERFTMLRSPYPTSSPYYPNRIGLILLGIVLGGLIAAIAVAVAETSDPTIRGSRDLPMDGGLELLGTIPLILTADDLQQRRRRRWGIAAAYGAAASFVGFTVFRALF